MSKQAWSEAVKTNNLEEHMLLVPLYYSFGDKEQKCWGVQVNVGGVQNMLGGCTNEVGGVRTPPENPPVHTLHPLLATGRPECTLCVRKVKQGPPSGPSFTTDQMAFHTF